MSEQSLDVQSVLSTMRRHRLLLAALTVVGALVAATLAQVHPPMYVSSAQVLLPAPDPGGNAAPRDSATDIRVALGDVVLGPAGAAVSPRLSSTQVRQRVSVDAPSSGILRITAKAPVAHNAEALAGAVANAEVAYQKEAASSVPAARRKALEARGSTLQSELDSVSEAIRTTQARMKTEDPTSKRWHGDATAVAELRAQQSQLALQVDTLKAQSAPDTTGQEASIIVSPTPAKRGDLVLWTLIAAGAGALLALGLSTLVLSIRSRKDRRLRTRDEVADAIGSAVIGSVRARPQRAAAGWTALMEGYEPSVTDAWSLRQALDHVGLGDLMLRSEDDGGRGPRRTRVLTLITLSEDPRGLAVGPQLASHAASLGLRTRLVAKQGHESSAALWAACSALRRNDEIRNGLHVDTRRRKGSDDLTIEIVVVDRLHPQFVTLDQNAVTLLAVASSSATAEDLARTAVAAYEAGGRISGVLVADPDSLDRTTGRLLLQQRSEQPLLPQRMTGLESAVDIDPSERNRR